MPCEYCLIHESDAGFRHQIDHIISIKDGGLSAADNLAYACILCNRYKGSDGAAIDDWWREHFRLEGARIEGRSATGVTTVRILRLNTPERLAERRLLLELGRFHV